MTSHRFISWAAAAALLVMPMAAAGQHHVSGPRARPAAGQPHSGDHASPAAKNATVSGRKADIVLSEATRIAGKLVPTGHYRVQMQHEGDRHVLVLALQETMRRGTSEYGIGDGREVLRVPCDYLGGGSKNRLTAFLVRPGSDGVPALSAIRIKGEPGNHVVAGSDTL